MQPKSLVKGHHLTYSLGFALVLLSFLSLFVGAIDLNWSQVLAGRASQDLHILLSARLPRLLAILCTGAGMSVAGLLMQQLCRNPFVSPTTGVTLQGAQMGIVLALLFLPSLGVWGRMLLAFATAMGGTWLFIWLLQRLPFQSTILLPLIGIMLGNLIGGLTNFLAYRYDLTQQLTSYFVGSFSLILKGNYELVWLVLPLLVLAFVFANSFNIVGMGQAISHNLGVPYQWILFLGLTICSLITASVVTVVGQISYIGLIIPNLISLIKGDRLASTLVDTALLGALFVLGCDLLARTLIAPYELPIELIVGVLGSLLFLGLLILRQVNPSSPSAKGVGE